MAAQTFILPAGGFILGIFISCGFGLIQDSAFVFHRRLSRIDNLANNWAGLSGSSARSMFLLEMLTLFHVAWSIIFGNNGIRWLVSAGVVLGYAWTLVQQSRQKTFDRP